jgi:hypothetical protein
MSKATDTTIGGGLMAFDKRVVRRFFKDGTGVVSKKRMQFSREELKILPSYSNMAEASDAWNLLSTPEKDAWNLAGLQCGLSAFNLFIADKIYRIRNSISGNATPSEIHQYLTGHIIIPESAGVFELKQSGSNAITAEGLLKISAKTDLIVSEDPGAFIKATFNYIIDSGGGPELKTTEIDLTLGVDWNIQSEIVLFFPGVFTSWQLIITGDKVHGELYFDNLFVEDVSGITTKDPYCNKNGKVFYGTIIPAGVIFESAYPPD